MNQELIDAAKNGDLRLVQDLLEEGADPNNARDAYTNTPLMWAAMSCHPRVVEELLEAGADPNQTGEQGDTPLMWAIRGEILHFIPPIVKMLIAAGADLNTQTVYFLDTALLVAVKLGDIPTIEELVKAGADPTLANYRGEAPVNYPIYQRVAEEQGLVELMLHLRHRGLPSLGISRGISRYLHRP